LKGTAEAGITMVALVPAAVAAQARAAAWLPADSEIRPRARWAGSMASSLLSTPRTLNEPVFWNSSALRKSRTRAAAPREVAEMSGVR